MLVVYFCELLTNNPTNTTAATSLTTFSTVHRNADVTVPSENECKLAAL